MKKPSTRLLTLGLLLPLAACPSDDEASPPVDFPAFTACASETDDGKDGDVDSRATFTYKDGNYLNDSYDLDLDGMVDQSVDYVFDGDDMIHYEIRERGEDGQLALIYVSDMTYDTGGHLLTDTYDFDGDGVVDGKATYVYDARGRLLEEHNDVGVDGKIDASTTYVQDAEGVNTHADIDADGDGVLDGKTTYAYGADGRLSREETDENLDGQADRIDTYEYGADGFRSRDTTDDDGDGQIEREYLFAYADGRFVSQTINYPASPEASSVSTYDYDCAAAKAMPARMAEARAKVRARMHRR